MFIKTAGLHALSHSENDLDFNDCDVCEFVITSNDSHFTNDNENFTEIVLINHYYKKSIFYYNYLFSQEQVDSSLFCRPPPTF